MMDQIVQKLADYGLAGVLLAVFVLFAYGTLRFAQQLLSKQFERHEKDMAWTRERHEKDMAWAREELSKSRTDFLVSLKEREQASGIATAQSRGEFLTALKEREQASGAMQAKLETFWEKRHEAIMVRLEKIEDRLPEE